MSNRKAGPTDNRRAAYLLAAIVDSSEDAIVSKDLNGVIQSWNKGAEGLFQFTADEAIGRSIRMIIPADRQHEEDVVLAKVRAGTPVSHFETQRQRKDGSLVDISLSVSPVRDGSGRIIGASKIARDITAQKRLIRDFADASRIKDEFVAMLSHELRTPLNAVLGYTQMLRAGEIADARRDQVIEIVERNAQLLSQLVSDVLDMSSIVSGKLRLRPVSVDLHEILRSSLEIVQPSASAKALLLTLGGDAAPLIVNGDPDRLHQAFWNLLTNGIKFTPHGGSVTVTLRRRGPLAEVLVADTGIGIPAEFIPRLFERFTQVESGSSREFGGLGMGLALVRHFIELHGGRIEAESPGEGQGSTFRATLPLIAAQG